ncbi:MAG: TetR/AcrR family transcriptional regulator [Christensenellales bacterium]
MESSQTDRRVRKTKALIRQTLTQLLLEKDLKDITVSELTVRADINRGTFYLHYQDIYDLFEQLEKDILNNFTEIITKYRKRSLSPFLPVLLETFRYIRSNSDIFIAILKTKETVFLTKIIEMCRPQNITEWRDLFCSGREEYFEYYYSFITFGCIALLRQWFENGMSETPEEIAALAENLMAAVRRI